MIRTIKNLFKKRTEYYNLNLLHNPFGADLKWDDIDYIKVYKEDKKARRTK